MNITTTTCKLKMKKFDKILTLKRQIYKSELLYGETNFDFVVISGNVYYVQLVTFYYPKFTQILKLYCFC